MISEVIQPRGVLQLKIVCVALSSSTNSSSSNFDKFRSIIEMSPCIAKEILTRRYS